MATFSKQDELPSLIVPNLNDTLDRYLKCARALVNDVDYQRTANQVEEFRNSKLAQQLQEALVNRSKQSRNWLEEWWYDAYTTIREPLSPYITIVSGNSYYKPLANSQLTRAADIAYHWMGFWKKVRDQTLPITRSRGVSWDMYQYGCLFNSVRVPQIPKDHMARYFRADSKCPSHIAVFCRGNVWKLEMLTSEDELITPDEIYEKLEWISKHSPPITESVITLTTDHRDSWAKQRLNLLQLPNNEKCLHEVETAALCLSLADEAYPDKERLLEAAMMSNTQTSWLDKNVTLIVFSDGQMVLSGDHSNVDAIVLLHCGDTAGPRVRPEIWKPKRSPSFTKPEKLDFTLDDGLKAAIRNAENNYQILKNSFETKLVRYLKYGNAFLKKNKLYTDTIIQLALQLAYLKTHGSFAPIYETASTRKFYHGRTETVRGCTTEMVNFGKAVMNNEEKSTLHMLMMKAYDAHNKLMEEATNGLGIDRHFLGLKTILENFNKGCSPKQALPKFMTDPVWKVTGGDGNFLLSTSLCGYMPDEEDASFGYVCAMRADGYGVFYRIANDRISLSTTDWKDSKSNLHAFGSNTIWAFDLIGSLLPELSHL